LGTFTDIFRYDFGDPPTLSLVTTLPDGQGVRAFSISPDGQELAFEWLPDIFLDQTSSLWITNSDGSTDPRWLANDAGRPAWGPSYVPEPVHAEFVGTPSSGVRPLLVQFTNQSTGDYDTCTWTFGDGGTSTSCGNPTHTYVTTGVYTVALTVNGPGGSDTRTRAGYIIVFEPVQANFTGSPTSVPPPLTVSFTNTSTGDYDSCAWIFGDGGTSSTCSNPTHTYATEGVYAVALTVSGPGGTDTQTRDRYIAVQDEYRVYLPLVLAGH
jgi:PKD repeat protein